MKSFDDIYNEIYLDFKRSGCMSSLIIMRKLKLTNKAAKKMIKEMHDSDKNYRFAVKRNLVGYIGSHPYLIRRRRKSKWIDVTKPLKKR